MMFVGLDVIGDYVTEINVTSPTGIRELKQENTLSTIGGMLVGGDPQDLERRRDPRSKTKPGSMLRTGLPPASDRMPDDMLPGRAVPWHRHTGA